MPDVSVTIIPGNPFYEYDLGPGSNDRATADFSAIGASYINTSSTGTTRTFGINYWQTEGVRFINAEHFSITGAAGDDNLNGDSGNDFLSGQGGNDALDGQTGSDTLFGGSGDDTLIAGAGGPDLIDGGAGQDFLQWNRSDATFAASFVFDAANAAGFQLADGSAVTGIERLDFWAGDQDDQVSVVAYDGNGVSTIDLAGGTDRGTGDMGNYTADIGTYADLNSGERFFFTGYWQSNGIKFYNTEAFSITGGSGHDNLVGDAGDDILFGGAGNDTLNGAIGNDSLYGGDGDDQLFAGAGPDYLDGGDGLDFLELNRSDAAFASDFVFDSQNTAGFALADGTTAIGIERLNYTAGDQDDQVSVVAYDGNGVSTIDLAGGTDRGIGDMGNYTADIGTFADLNSGERFFFTGYWQSNGIKFYNTEAFSITGGSGHDNLVGGADADILIGGAGHDNLDGGAGDDMLSGGDGNDVLVGGAGNDTFDGGAGTDSAQFAVASTDITVGHNGTALVITSSEGVDQVEFGVENLIFSDTTLRFAQVEGLIPGDQVSTFDFGTEGWTTSNGTETFDASTGNSGGSVRGTEGGSGVWTFIAPPSFLGDQGRYYGGTLSFDLRQDGDASQYFDNDVTLRSTGLTLVADLGDNPMTEWTSYSIDLELGAGWRIGSLSGRIATGQEIQSVLSDLEAFTIRGEFVDGAIDDASNLDNVSLVVGPPPPDHTGGPTITSTFDTDIDGWSFIADVREFRHVIDGGNPGGYLEGVDYTTGETWYFVAAEKYLGDKSAYFGGSLSFDLKQSELSSQFNNDDVVLIGSTVTLVHNILRPETDWTSYTLNLDIRADWRIGSETGEVATEAQIQEALASLQTLRIRGEYVSGSDTGGLDNVVLQSANVATVYSTPDRVHALASFASVQTALNTAEAGQAIQITGDLPIAAAYVPVSDLTVFADAPFAMGLTLGTNVTAISLGGSAALAVAGTDAGDQISGSDGANALRGYAGNDTLLGNAGADTVFGGVGNDFLAGGVGDDAVYGEDGNDTIYLGLGNDIGGGGAGNDAIYGGADANAIWGGLGDDTVHGGTGNDSVYGGGQGTNQLFGNDGADLIYTGSGGDFVGGGAGNDVIRGGDGADTIYGGIGDNNVGGGGGDDFLRMAEGNDTVYGGLGDDNIGAGAGNDLIIDGAGNNVIWGGLGSDTVQGGAGQDTIYGGGDGANQLLGNGGNDVIWGGTGNDFIGGGTGNDEIYGDAGNDTIFAGMGNDFIGGGAGDDLIYGSGGDNRVYLGVGNDTFIAGTNKDIVTGGPGTDVFVFQSAAQIGIGSGRDSITDFIHGEDKIDLSSLNTQFNGTSGFLGGSDSSFFYFAAGGLLIGDADGNGIVDWVLELGGAPAVAMDDFIL